MSDAANPTTAPEDQVFGHEPGLFLLFFTEMWERFSYYGMRALLVLFLVSEIAGGGWGWSREDALYLYAIYTGLVYLTPILGGIMADKVLGYRGAVLLGALLMTLGHASLAFETASTFYIGLGLLILGNGFFKPNISTIVGQLYANNAERKDAAYTIFYMGINAGAFLGILLCGFVGEQIGWSYGFGLAGIFMLLGMIMFQLGQSIFGEIGTLGYKAETAGGTQVEVSGATAVTGTETENPFQSPSADADTAKPPVKIGEESPDVIRDRLIVVGILSFFTIFFWMAFEQAGGSLTIFAKDYTQRVLTGSAHTTFVVVNTLLTLAPLAIVTYVLANLFQKTFAKIPYSNLAIGLSFVMIWAIAIYMLSYQFNTKSYEITFMVPVEVDEAEAAMLKQAETILTGESSPIVASEQEMTEVMRTIRSASALEEGSEIYVVDMEQKAGQGKLKKVTKEQADEYATKFVANVVREKQSETEVPASWFGILNSFFIIAFAPLFSKLWETRLNPSAPVKFALGLILLGLGFGAVAIGSSTIETGAESASVSLWWLVFAYLFHTLGELCLSPVGLSYVSKLAPAKLVGLMFGVWFFATAIANYLAGWTGSYIDQISEQIGLVGFFLIYTAIPIAAGLVLIALNGMIKKMMHGIE
ncbi:MAG: peptide MFS transporter [Planctomycetota bacterium]